MTKKMGEVGWMKANRISWVAVGIIGALVISIIVLVLIKPAYFGLHTIQPSTYNEQNSGENFSYYNITEEDIRTGREVEIEVKAGTPYVLPDGESKIIVSTGYYVTERQDIAEIQLANTKLGLLSFTEVAIGGFVYKIHGPYNCSAYTGGSKDNIVTLVDSCHFNLTVTKGQSFLIVLETYNGIVKGATNYSEGYGKGPLYRIDGTNGHFIGVRSLGAVLDNISFEIITNFGVQTISFYVFDSKPQVIRLASEEITATLLSYDRSSKYFILKLEVAPIPSVTDPGVIIIDYRNGSFNRGIIWEKGRGLIV